MDVRMRMLEKLKEVGFDFSQFSMDNFVVHIEKLINREIMMIGWSMPQGMYGAWISITDVKREYIFFNTYYSHHQRINAQLHELCHVICNHSTLKITLAELRALIEYGNLDSLFEKALLRSPDSTQDDVEAETMAILVQESAAKCNRLKQLTTLATNEQSLRYMEKVGFTHV